MKFLKAFMNEYFIYFKNLKEIFINFYNSGDNQEKISFILSLVIYIVLSIFINYQVYLYLFKTVDLVDVVIFTILINVVIVNLFIYIISDKEFETTIDEIRFKIFNIITFFIFVIFILILSAINSTSLYIFLGHILVYAIIFPLNTLLFFTLIILIFTVFHLIIEAYSSTKNSISKQIKDVKTFLDYLKAKNENN